MTREEQLDWLCRLRSEVKIYMPIEWVDHFEDALTESINELSQEPTDTVSRGAFEQVCKERDIAIEQLHELGYEWGQKIEPCDDAIGREAVIKAVDAHTNEDGTLDDDISVILEDLPPVTQTPKYWIDKDNKLYKMPDDLPSVTQKPGKWDRLYNWLNDMRLGIAPDETVTDIDERLCRESQTDIIDEIMEWMIKAEVEPHVTQKSGKWDNSCTCSVCGKWKILESEKNGGKYKFCPNCGSAMKGE